MTNDERVEAYLKGMPTAVREAASIADFADEDGWLPNERPADADVEAEEVDEDGDE